MASNNLRALALAERRMSQFKAEERGSLTIFSLFLFVLILFIAGMAVDIMRYETERTELQNTVDTAIIAASSLTQEANTNAEVEALVKDYVSKAGYDPAMVTVTPNIEIPAGSTSATSRSVTATFDFKMNTMFMNMMGIDTLEGHAGSAAKEGQQLIEIALVLDISKSMTWNSKMENLRTAAKEFVSTIIQNSGSSRVSISIVPYSHQVFMDAELMSRLNLVDQKVNVPGANSAPAGAVTSYVTRNPNAPCATFYEGDFATRRLTATTNVEPSASFVDDRYFWELNGESNQPFEQPFDFSYRCGTYYPTLLLYQSDETVLHNYIDNLSGYGGTVIDYGMNWGVGVLDPSFEPIVRGMVQDNILAPQMLGHPVNYDNADVLKYVVLMTDGINSSHMDLREEYKSGPTRIWHSATRASDNGNEYDGFLVEMPSKPAAERWYVPGDPTTDIDDSYIAESALPPDAQQWDFHKLYGRFRTNDVANYFFQYSDVAAHAEYLDVVADTGSDAVADARLGTICTAAKEDNAIEIFTVSFEAPIEGAAVLMDCASNPGNYFDVSGTQISTAFGTIASQISQLRLTE